MTEFLKTGSFADILFFIVAAVFVIRGFIRGFSGEIGSLLGVVAAVATAYFGSSGVSAFIRASGWGGESKLLVEVTVFAVMLVACVAAWLLVSFAAKALLKSIFGQPFDSVLGGVVGGAKAIALLALLCSLGWLMPVKNWVETVASGSPLVKSINHTVKPR